MSEHFLLTYSVRNEDGDKNDHKTNSVRDDICALTYSDVCEISDSVCSAIYDWEKLEIIETTIKGKIYLSGDNLAQKKSHSKKIIREIFNEVLDVNNAKSSKTQIHCAMLVDSLGEAFTFQV
ncbi:hypothetical protein [Kosakonia sacchari]|uniref:hypothetical protein n=1 Tax=Kosakonia sacchari TaxID=1158459 RepID=UPI0013633105|nr:hypothetical protein [Kosakonia sacchari]QHM95983.1 hypothetical protein FGE25_17690 [Kosakonia sacchari]